MTHENDMALPCFVFDTQSFDCEEAYWQWQQNIAPLFDAQIPPRQRSEFSANAVAYLADHCVISRSRFTQQTFERDRYWSEQYDPEHIVIQLYLSGGFAGVSGGQSIDVQAGDIAVLDLRYNLKTFDQTSDVLSVVIPRAVYQGHMGNSVKLSSMVIPGRHSLALVIADQIKLVWRQLPHLDGDMAMAVVDRNVEMLLDYLLMAMRQLDGPLVAARLKKKQEILTFIEANLGDEGLNVSTLASVLSISRSSIYRLFEAEGGLMNYIQRRRLDKCYRLLECGYPGKITDIAADWGFNDHSHFSASFKKAYALTPTELRQKNAARALIQDVSQQPGVFSQPEVHRWLMAL